VKTLCFTGHRPNKLGGYKTPNSTYLAVKSLLSQAIDRAIKEGYDTFISGGALGVDQWALEVLYQKNIPGKIIIARPFPSQSCKWPEKSQKDFEFLLSMANQVVDVCEDPYASWKMQKRNEWMVDRSELVIAVWDGTDGGTGNCVKYAQKCGKTVWKISL